MTTIFVEIAHPTYFYNRVGINCAKILSEAECIKQIKKALEENLKKHGVSQVFVKLGNPDMYYHLFLVKMMNTKNDWQEEQIREEIDNTCLDFIDRKNLQYLCEE